MQNRTILFMKMRVAKPNVYKQNINIYINVYLQENVLYMYRVIKKICNRVILGNVGDITALVIVK
jgi:hypothetical protein